MNSPGREDSTSGDRTGRHTLALWLRQHSIDWEITQPGVPTPTAPDAAKALGVEETEIIKSLQFGDDDGRWVLAIMRGTDRVEKRMLAEVAGTKKLLMASPADVERITGYTIGGVPPIGHARASELTVIIDRAVLDNEFVYGGGGDEHSMLKIRAAEILRLSGGTLADIRQQ